MPDLGPMTEWQEYEEQEQEAEKLERLNALLRAARDGTIFDMREDRNGAANS